jgi:hypothetical protein
MTMTPKRCQNDATLISPQRHSPLRTRVLPRRSPPRQTPSSFSYR